MSVDDIVKLIDAITKLIEVIIWPGILIFVMVRFGTDLRDFFYNLSEASLKGAGFELFVKRKQAEAAVALAAATVSRSDDAQVSETEIKEAKAVANLTANTVTPQLLKQAEMSSILWVNDRPQCNVNERRSLQALGINLVLATSTEEALERIQKQHFDAIISDMRRPGDIEAGYTLLDKLRAIANNTPYIIYAGSRAPEQLTEARERGAIAATSRPNELFKVVLSALELKGNS